jgi:hypothetical protein
LRLSRSRSSHGCPIAAIGDEGAGAAHRRLADSIPVTIIRAAVRRAWIIDDACLRSSQCCVTLRAPSVRMALTKYIQTQRG